MGNAWKRSRFQSAYLRNTLWDLGYAVDTLETAITWDKVTLHELYYGITPYTP